GEVLTNNHVIEGATSISVTVSGSSQRYSAVVVGTAPTEDLAVLRIQGVSGLEPVTLGDSSLVEVGDPVVALGNAGGAGGAPDVRTGTVRALDQTITAADQNGSHPRTLLGMIQTDAPLQPGDSGGPLVNRSSEVIGIDTAAGRDRRFRSADTVGFAIPSNRARSIAAQIQSGQSRATVHIGAPGFLGVVLADKAPAGTVTPGAGGGALVMAVEPGSPAAAAGLLAGVTITAIDGQSLADAAATVSLVRSHHPGDTLMVSWTDSSNTTHTAPVTLAAGWAD
ncbi:MAG: S1C family serine protease, partial [Acidimicrobiia bacterium]